jgi:hypothetical protein
MFFETSIMCLLVGFVISVLCINLLFFFDRTCKLIYNLQTYIYLTFTCNDQRDYYPMLSEQSLSFWTLMAELSGN